MVSNARSCVGVILVPFQKSGNPPERGVRVLLFYWISGITLEEINLMTALPDWEAAWFLSIFYTNTRGVGVSSF
jgi:hypothetical protein